MAAPAAAAGITTRAGTISERPRFPRGLAWLLPGHPEEGLGRVGAPQHIQRGFELEIVRYATAELSGLTPFLKGDLPLEVVADVAGCPHEAYALIWLRIVSLRLS